MGRRRRKEKKKKKKSQNRRVVDWLELEKDVLELIAKKLTVLVDFIRFGAVCKTWRFIFLENRHRPLHKLPVLLIPGDKNNEFWSFFIFSEQKQKTYRFKKLPEEKDRCCCGSSEGYLIMVDPNLNIFLLNLFSGIETPLPCLTTISKYIGVCGMDTGTIEYSYRFPIPDHPTLVEIARSMDQYVYKAIKAGAYVVAILAKQSVLAFCKLDGDGWTYVQSKFRWEDLVCYNGKFYVIGYYGHVGVLDVSGLHPTLTTIVERDIQYYDHDFRKCLVEDRKYLVESSGQLLMVFREIKRRSFKIFRVDVSKHLCFPVNALGDSMLFLGENSLVSSSARDFSKWEGNYIYFLAWDRDFYLGVYSVKSGNCLQRYYKMDWKWKWQHPIWLTPKLW